MGRWLWPHGGNRPRQRPFDPLRPSVGDRRQGWRSDQDRTGDRRRGLNRQIDRPASALRNQDRRRSGRPTEIPARRRAAERGLKLREWAACLDRRLVSDLAADDVTEQLPALAVEFHQLYLLNREKVISAGVELDAGQHHVG